MERQTSARFFRKPIQVTDLRDDTPIIKPAPFRIVREIILPEVQYCRFQANLLANAPFVAAIPILPDMTRELAFAACWLPAEKGKMVSS